MRLIVLDEDFETLGAIPLFRTLIWIRRYQKLGAFELYTTKEYFPLLSKGRYLYRNDAEELGVIDEVNYAQDDSGSREIFAKGNFAECLLQNRVISESTALSGSLELAMRNLVTKFAISPKDPGRIIKHLRLGTTNGLKPTVNMQALGDDLSAKLYALGNAENISHRVRYDYQTNDLAFEVWEGKDRRDSQTENSWAIFSNSFYNIRDAIYNRDSSSYKNFAYVAGEGEGNARVIVEVDLRSDKSEERREIFVDARDLQSGDGNGNKLSAAQYRALLVQRGKEKLIEYQKVETVTSSVDSHANLEYKKDYDLGDYCTYINTEIGIETAQRITEIMETYEGGSIELIVTFGNEGITTVKQLIKREAA